MQFYLPKCMNKRRQQFKRNFVISEKYNIKTVKFQEQILTAATVHTFKTEFSDFRQMPFC